MNSIWGQNFTVSLFGESHGPKIGVVIGGVKPGLSIDLEKIQAFLNRRKAGGEAWSTKRSEPDTFSIISGLFNGHTTGTPLCALCDNTDTRSEDYSPRCNRPGHADFTGSVRYGGFNDYRGGGHFSGRLTAPLVFAGAVAAQILEKKGIYAASHILRIADIKDHRFDNAIITKEQADEMKSMRFPLIDETKKVYMEQKILAALEAGDSVGGIVECAIFGLPTGVGNPFFGSVESVLSSILFSIPAVKGVSFGAGFRFAQMRGSEANDAYDTDGSSIVTTTNNNGGILGGITSGMPVVFQTVVKPTPSISMSQKTVNLETLKPETIAIKGRHDPCIVPRAVAAIEAAACIGILDLMMERGIYHGI
ncbi:MAG: chorismate synthase [Christensenellales bacterium]|jgi:chorismate synthase